MVLKQYFRETDKDPVARFRAARISVGPEFRGRANRPLHSQRLLLWRFRVAGGRDIVIAADNTAFVYRKLTGGLFRRQRQQSLRRYGVVSQRVLRHDRAHHRRQRSRGIATLSVQRKGAEETVTIARG
jgi:hypothetical protein